MIAIMSTLSPSPASPTGVKHLLPAVSQDILERPSYLRIPRPHRVLLCTYCGKCYVRRNYERYIDKVYHLKGSIKRGEAFGAMTRSDDSLGAMTCQAALIFIEENTSFAKITMRSSYNSLLSMCLSTIDHVVDLKIVAAKIMKNSISTPSLTLSEAEALPAAVPLQPNSTPGASFVCKPHTNEARGVFPTV